MCSQAAVHSIDALKEFRAALAIYGEDAMAGLGGVDMELRRVALWLEQDRPLYWKEQIRRRQEMVSSAKADVFKRRLSSKHPNPPGLAEAMEKLRHAEASLRDAEHRLNLSRKWHGMFHHVMLEYHASTRRLRSLASGEVPRGASLLGRIIDTLEAYLRESPPSGPAAAPSASPSRAPAEFEAIASTAIDAEPAPAEEAAGPEGEAPTPEPAKD